MYETEGVLRLHLNESPYGPPPAALEAAREEVGRHSMRYPESDSGELRCRIAEYLDVPPEMVAVGNGVDELVLMAALAFSGSGSTVVMTDTTFPGYLFSAQAVKATPKSVPLRDLRISAADMVAAIKEDADLAYLCNPHNPTGTVLGRAEVDAVVTAAESAGTVLVVDEAYMDFADDGTASTLEAVRAGRRVVTLRTFSKAWGLASLRTGYAVGPADLIAKMWQARRSLPFNVNRPAQHAVPVALRQTHFLENVRRRTAEARELLYARLVELEMPFVHSATNFVMVGTADSSVLTQRLADEHHILVRDLTLFGLSGWIRVTVGTPEEVDRLATALQTVREPAAVPATTGRTTNPHWLVPVPTLPAIEAAELFNGYTGAQVAVVLNEFGVWAALTQAPMPVHTLAANGGVSTEWMYILLRTMALLGHVELHDGTAALTEPGRSLARQMGMFVWGVGGYGSLLTHLSGLSTGKLRYGVDVFRDEKRIAMGTGEVARSLMLPVEAAVLDATEFDVVADVRCGDATRLIRLCGQNDKRRGIGIDISQPACDLAAQRVHSAGLSDRVEIVCEDVLTSIGRRTFPEVDLVTSYFMLHDLFDSDEDPVAVLRSLRAAFPSAGHFLFADSAALPWHEHKSRAPVFSVEFELVHAAMGVELRGKETYLRAFEEAGLSLKRCEPFGAPSTWIFLLSRA